MQKIIDITEGVAGNPLFAFTSPINLTVYNGEQIAVVGDNASGKSRFAQMLTGRYQFRGNALKYDFAPSQYKLVSDNVKYITFLDAYGHSGGGYYLQQRWESQQEENDDGTLKLSSGELRKYQIGKALENMPRVLVLDNPYIGLDAQSREELTELLKNLIASKPLLVIMILAKSDDIPDFITHVVPVSGLSVGSKMEVGEYLSAGSREKECCKANGEGCRETNVEKSIASIPEKNLSEVAFYPKEEGAEVLRFNRITIAYGERTILKKLEWCVHEGERWALSGENGAGKSTLLSLVCADNPQAYACDIEIFGHKRGSGESIWEIKRHIGYVSPEMFRAYSSNLPCEDIVASGFFDTPGITHRLDQEQLRTRDLWMEIFGISHLKGRSYLQISSGEQRLCLLARAFVKDPELLILDEPMHGLDQRNCNLVKRVITAFAQRNHKTLLMVSHYASDFPECIDHVLTMKKN